MLAKANRRTINLIMANPDVPLPETQYLQRLWEGAPLPTDEAGEAEIAIRQLERALREGGKAVSVPPLAGLKPPDLEMIRLNLLQSLYLEEQRFAVEQRTDQRYSWAPGDSGEQHQT